MTGQRKLPSRVPRSCIRNQSQENLLERTKIVLAVPSYSRQRLSGIGRGWCPPRSLGMQGIERVIRSDSGVAHHLSLSARVLSAVDSQVKAKRRGQKRLWRLRNLRVREFQPAPETLPSWAKTAYLEAPAEHPSPLAEMRTARTVANRAIDGTWEGSNAGRSRTESARHIITRVI